MAVNVTLDDPYGYWPIEWNFGEKPCDGSDGPPTDNPDVLRVVFSLIDEDDQKIDLSLESCVQRMIEGGIRHDTGKFAIQHVRSAKAIRDHLRKLADLIDEAIEPSGA